MGLEFKLDAYVYVNELLCLQGTQLYLISIFAIVKAKPHIAQKEHLGNLTTVYSDDFTAVDRRPVKYMQLHSPFY